jgi:hypothetical protein
VGSRLSACILLERRASQVVATHGFQALYNNTQRELLQVASLPPELKPHLDTPFQVFSRTSSLILIKLQTSYKTLSFIYILYRAPWLILNETSTHGLTPAYRDHSFYAKFIFQNVISKAMQLLQLFLPVLHQLVHNLRHRNFFVRVDSNIGSGEPFENVNT